MSRIIRIFAVISVATTLAVAAGPAMAGEFNTSQNGTLVEVPPTGAQSTGTDSAPTVVHVTTDNGFNWGDAAIGAAAGVAISLLLLGGGLSITQRHSAGHIRHA